MGFDWFLSFRPASLAFLTGQDPYAVPHFLNPPWLLPIIAPLALLPPIWGAAGMGLITLSGLVALCRKAGKIWMALPLALSFPVMVLLWVANVDGLSLWGLTVGGPIGLLLISTKPQVAGLVGIVWAVQAWREGGWRKVAVLIAPTLSAAVIFLFIYPHWPSAIFVVTDSAHHGSETTGFPWYLPLGLALLVAAVRRGREDWAALATMMVTPYSRTQSWLGALALLTFQYPLEGMIAVAASWLIPIFIVGKL